MTPDSAGRTRAIFPKAPRLAFLTSALRENARRPSLLGERTRRDATVDAQRVHARAAAIAAERAAFMPLCCNLHGSLQRLFIMRQRDKHQCFHFFVASVVWQTASFHNYRDFQSAFYHRSLDRSKVSSDSYPAAFITANVTPMVIAMIGVILCLRGCRIEF